MIWSRRSAFHGLRSRYGKDRGSVLWLGSGRPGCVGQENTDVSASGHHTPPKNASSQRMSWPKLLKTTAIGPDQKEPHPKDIEKPESTLEGSASRSCPKCGKKTYSLAASNPHSIFGNLGAVERTYNCDSCGFSEKEMIQPKVTQ